MNADEARRLCKADDSHFDQIIEEIRRVAESGGRCLGWNNGGDLVINPEIPCEWPSQTQVARLKALGFSVEERHYPDSGILCLDVCW